MQRTYWKKPRQRLRPYPRALAPSGTKTDLPLVVYRGTLDKDLDEYVKTREDDRTYSLGHMPRTTFRELIATVTSLSWVDCPATKRARTLSNEHD